MSALQAPFPYFGGKRRAASIIWDALGDPGGYVEPFAGSAAVLLARPPVKGRRVETINDMDGWLVNAWRSIRLSPTEVAAHAVGPVSELDYHARLAWLQERRNDGLVTWLEGNPEAHDPKAAAWWLYVAACGIGDPWGPGPWRVVDEHLTDTRTPAPRQRGAGHPPGADGERGVNRKLPHLGDAGRGIHRALPHLGDAGQGGIHLESLTSYMMQLAWRLERVRITCGSWNRILGPSVTRASAGNGNVGIVLDPPYSTSGDLYAVTNAGGDEHESISAQVAEWCANAPNDLRIVLCGYDAEHDDLLERGWRKVEGKSGGGAGYSVRKDNGRRERLWLSPACVGHVDEELDFGGVA